MYGGTFIPKRIYDLLKCIYTERMTAVCAPSGSGKSTILREFVRRSRPAGYSCRFVTGCATADECFCRISSIIFGQEVHLPVTEDNGVALYRLNSNCRLDRPLLIVVDCPPAAEMLLGNLYCLKLFQDRDMSHIVILTDEKSYFEDVIIRSVYVREITEQDLALTAEETRQYLALCSVYDADHETICERSKGNIFRIRLCALLLRSGQRIRSYDTLRLIHAAIISGADRALFLALLCASSQGEVSARMCKAMREEPALVEYYGVRTLDCKYLQDLLREMNDVLPVIRIDDKSGIFDVHELVRRSVYRSFVMLPLNVRHGMYICTAKEYTLKGKHFEAFCNYVMAKDYYSAALIEYNDSMMSASPFLNAKEAMFRFVLECPLDCKPILPWLLHVLVLLMFTSYKERVVFRFDEIIGYLTSSPDYTEQERRSILAYAHVMRTYQDFYVIDRMGMHIKRAYEYFTGESVFTPPFYLWALYVPSMFALVHRYSAPLSAQTEQFVRYNRMYMEIAGHGSFFDRVYLAEMRYNVGDIADARERALSIIAETSGMTDAAPKLIASIIAAKCELLSGSYDEYKARITDISEMMRTYPDTEVYRMGALCLALLGCICLDIADVWRVTASTDTMILSNRYTAPFCYYVRCIYMLESKEYARLLSRLSYFLDIIEEVHSETLAIKIKLCAATAYYNIEDTTNALAIVDEVLGVLVPSGVIMPAVEMCVHEPKLFLLARRQLDEAYGDYLEEVMRIAKSLSRNIDNIRTQQLTATWHEVRRNEQTLSQFDSAARSAKQFHRELGLTEKALLYALLAAQGYSNEDIAALCGTTVNSVKSSLKRTYVKLGVRTRSQLRYQPQLKKLLHAD